MAIELLSPAGSEESLKAALDAGADAVYLGCGRLNARGESAQFPKAKLPLIADEIHRAGAELHLTLNILLRDDELEEALDLAREAYRAGADAVIVQDRGLMRLLAKELPELKVHASTQCSCGTKEAAEAYRRLGCRRIVLPRELSLEEIAELSSYAHEIGVETEVFVHGALCMSVSGQCHMSHFMGGRSANRGDCAQPCRMRYRIEKDGRPFRREAAWLSPADIGAFSILDKLLAAGVDSLKIEGRLRRPDYVGQVTAVYRQALDELEAGLPPEKVLTEARERELLIAFNRGGSFNQQYFRDERSRDFLSAEETGHRGLYLGSADKISAREGLLTLRLDRSVLDYLPQAGSQITLTDGEGERFSAPCGVIRRGREKGTLELKGFHPKVLRKLRLPLKAWQMNQDSVPEQKAIAPKAEPLSMRLYEDETRGLVLALESRGRRLEVSEKDLPEAPEQLPQAISEERCRVQLGKLGSTPYRAARIRLDALPYWRVRDLNALRRLALERFMNGEGERPDEKKNESAAFAAEPEMAFRKASKTWERTAALPFWQGGTLQPFSPDDSVLLLLPLDPLLNISKKTASYLRALCSSGQDLGVIFPPSLKFSTEKEAWQKLGLLHEYIHFKALAMGPSGLPAKARAHGFAEAELIAWQGSQIWNTQTLDALAAEGYTQFLLSPELDGASLEHLIQKRAGDLALLFWRYGRTQAMYTRFCPIGFSQSWERCGLCGDADFAFLDEKERRFPLRPKPFHDCSFEVWQSEPLQRSLNLASRDAKGRRRFGELYVFTDEKPSEIRRIMSTAK